MTKAVIYARYSCENQREESIEGQLRECLAFAKHKGFEVVDKYIDRAISAKTDDRPSFQQMIHDGTDHKFDVVIVWKMDRFSRNRLNALQYKSILKKAHVKLISATEAISDGPEGILLESVLDGMAEYYSADLAQKVKRGMTENVLEGKFNGGPVPFGYDVVNGRFVVNENQALIVKEIFYQYANTGMSANQLAKYFSDKGVFYKNGKPFDSGTIYGILGNRKYIGEYRLGEHVNKQGIPALVDEELFTRAVNKRAVFKKHASQFKSKIGYPLSGKAFCGLCGESLVGESSTKKERTYNYYRCRNYRRTHCLLPEVKSSLLEKVVMEALVSFLKDNINIKEMQQAIVERQTGSSSTLKILENQLKATNTKMGNILATIEEGRGVDGLSQRYHELEKEKKKLEEDISKEKKSLPSIGQKDILLTLPSMANLDFEDKGTKERLISQFIDSVFLYPDGKVQIFFYFIGSEHVSFENLSNGEIQVIKCKGESYQEKYIGDKCFGISVKNPSFRFSDKKRYKMKSIYKNGTNQYYKFLNTLFDMVSGLQSIDLINDQMKRKPKFLKKDFLEEMSSL